MGMESGSVGGCMCEEDGFVGQLSSVIGRKARDGHEGPPRMSVFDSSKILNVTALSPFQFLLLWLLLLSVGRREH
jgi:hypothetical protein